MTNDKLINAGDRLKVEMWLGSDGEWKWTLFERNGQFWDWLESGGRTLMRDAADGAHVAYNRHVRRIVSNAIACDSCEGGGCDHCLPEPYDAESR